MAQDLSKFLKIIITLKYYFREILMGKVEKDKQSTIKGEIEYAKKASKIGWVEKPFGNQPKLCAIHFENFANILRFLNPSKGSNVLDFGVGTGWTSIFLSKTGCKVTRVDISSDYIKLAKKKCEKWGGNCSFLVGDIEEITIKEKFDYALIYESLHHCFDPEKVIRNVSRHLKSGAKFLLVEPNLIHNFKAKRGATEQNTTEKGFTKRYLKKILIKSSFKEVKYVKNKWGYYWLPIWILAIKQ